MFRARIVAVCGSVFAVALLLGTLAYGQTSGGTILGSVSDDSGARVPSVSVTVRNVATGITRSIQTDGAGRYRAPNLDPGIYEVRAELTGFRTAVRQGVQVTVASELVVDLSLQVGTVTEQVIVTGEAPLIETTSAALSGLVDDKKIRDLPLNGRSFEQLAFLQPGVTPYYRANATRATDQGEGTKFSVSGSRVDSNSFLLDGTNIADQSNATPGSAAGQLLGVEMLQEFRILTGNYSAEYGRYSGGIITAASKSGTNQLHGNLFYFHRNDNLDARDFFEQQKGEFKRNQFGGTIGGPILRDRTFFFSGYEGLRERKGLPTIAIVPDANVHVGCLPGSGTQGNCPAGTRFVGVESRVQPFLDLFPAPNGQLFPDEGTGEFISSPKRPIREDYTMGRVDHQFSDSDFFFARYTFSDANLSDPDEFPTFTVDSITRAQYVTAGLKRIFSPTILNEFRAGFSRNHSDQSNIPLFDVTDDLLFIPGQQFGLITFRSPAITTYGGGQGYPRTFGHNVWQLGDDMTVSRGSHTFKMGFLYERTQSNSTLSRDFGGRYIFEGLQNFVRGTAAEVSADVPGTDADRGWRQHLFGFYFQDDFQVRRNLTLNLGLRYEFTTVPTEVNGKIANFPNPRTDALPTCLKAGQRSTTGACNFTADSWFEGSYRDFAPRIGLSWDPWGNGRTSIRAGFGMYYDHIVAQPLNRALTRTPPFQQSIRLTGAAAQFPRVDPSRLVSPPLTSLTTYNVQNRMFDPVKIGYSFSIQQQVGPQMVVNAAYAGAHSYHQLVGNNGNNRLPSPIPAGIDRTGSYFVSSSPRRNPNLGQIQFMITPEGSSTYHSLQLSANRRFSNGLQMQVSYTHAKFLADSEAVFGRGIDVGGTVPQDPDNIGGERSLSSFDIRNYFSSNFTYDLPLGRNLSGAAGKVLSGWQINGILGLANGTPVNMLTGFNRSRNGATGTQVTDRPDLLPGYEGKNLTKGVSAGCHGFEAGPVGTPDRYVDLCAFGLPPAGFYGNLGRNVVISPGLANFDFAVMKNLTLTESKSLQFRFEFFNLFNRVNLSRPGPPQEGTRVLELPDTDPVTRQPVDLLGKRIASASAIQSTITDPRRIQLGMKLTF